MGEKITIKQDINFLYNPMWILNHRHDGMGFVYEIDGYTYRTGYKVPDKVDMLFLFYFLHKAQNNDYEKKVTFTRCEILKACNLSPNPQYYKRLEDSLERWKNVSIKFQGTFYDNKEYKTFLFGVIDNGYIDEKNKVHVEFNKNWLLKIKNSNFFKYINFHYYKALKRPVSRRLHEILCTKFLYNNRWSISLVKLGEKLTLAKMKRKDGAEGVIYASRVIAKVKPAINEINKLANDKDLAKKAGIKPKDLFTISYQITGIKQDRVIVFTKQSLEPDTDQPGIENLLELLKKRTKKLEKIIAKYHEEKDFDYVKNCIEYANAKAKKNYSTYLQQTLSENWAEDWEYEKTIEQKRSEIEAKLSKAKEKVEQFVEKLGGIRKLRYNGQIFDFFQQGLLLLDQNSSLLWHEIDLDLFSKV